MQLILQSNQGDLLCLFKLDPNLQCCFTAAAVTMWGLCHRCSWAGLPDDNEHLPQYKTTTGNGWMCMRGHLPDRQARQPGCAQGHTCSIATSAATAAVLGQHTAIYRASAYLSCDVLSHAYPIPYTNTAMYSQHFGPLATPNTAMKQHQAAISIATPAAFNGVAAAMLR